jgi:hypothetical protein
MRVLIAAVFASLVVTVACGGESESTNSNGGSGGDGGSSGNAGTSSGGVNSGGTTPTGGDGGTGGSSTECAGLVCDPLILPGPYPPVEACCAAGNQCGLDGSALEEFGITLVAACQARDQPGEVDSECDPSPPFQTDFGDLSFDGCCTPEGHCGYLLDNAFNLITIGLGCVDTAVVEGAVPASCTPG